MYGTHQKIYLQQMVNFHSYVKLSEGNSGIMHWLSGGWTHNSWTGNPAPSSIILDKTGFRSHCSMIIKLVGMYCSINIIIIIIKWLGYEWDSKQNYLGFNISRDTLWNLGGIRTEARFGSDPILALTMILRWKLPYDWGRSIHSPSKPSMLGYLYRMVPPSYVVFGLVSPHQLLRYIYIYLP